MDSRLVKMDEFSPTDNSQDIFNDLYGEESNQLLVEDTQPPAQNGYLSWIGSALSTAGNAMKYTFVATTGAVKYAMVATAGAVKDTAVAAFISAKDGINYARSNPVSTGVAISAASVNAVNALTAPAGISPEELGTKWWNSMNGAMRFYSIISSASALTINTIMNARFIPQAGQKLKNSLSELRKGCGKIILNSVSVFLGLGAGFAQGSIAYAAYQWLPLGTFTAAPIALLAAVVTFSGRYLSVKSIISRIMNLFNANARMQQTYGDLMEHINPYYLDYLEQQLQEIIASLFDNHHPDEPLTEDEYQALIQALSEKLHELQAAHPDLIQGKSTSEYIAKYAGLLADVTIALFCSTSGFMTFDQKGFDGVNTIAKLARNPLDGLAAGWRGLIGANPGLASFMFFGNHGMNTRGTITDLIKELYHNPRRIPGAIMLLAVNGVSANSMNSVGQSVLKNPNNIFGMTRNFFGSAYLALITFAGASGNSNTTVRSFLAKPATSSRNLKIRDVAKHLGNADEHPIYDATASALARNSLFIPAKPIVKARTPVQDPDTPPSWNPFDASYSSKNAL